MRRKLLFVFIALALLTATLFAPRPITKAADCDVVRANCRGAADGYQSMCLQSGGSGDFCSQQWTWFYMTCVEGVGCPAGIN